MQNDPHETIGGVLQAQFDVKKHSLSEAAPVGIKPISKGSQRLISGAIRYAIAHPCRLSPCSHKGEHHEVTEGGYKIGAIEIGGKRIMPSVLHDEPMGSN